MNYFKPYPAVNEMLDAFISLVQQTLGDNLVGLYLDRSLATGDFDEQSDEAIRDARATRRT